MKKKDLIYTALLLILASCFSACNEKDDTEKEPACNFDNPLTELLWLKTKVDENTLLLQQGNPLRVSIHQCMYDDGKIGFLIDKGNTKTFYNCGGETLCIMGGVAGETSPELNIVSRELIWYIPKEPVCNVDDPLTDLPWLKDEFKVLEEMPGFSRLDIRLYKISGTDEHLFQIGIGYSESDNSPFGSSASWKNCMGKIVFHVKSGAPPFPPDALEIFMKDKELVVELYHSIKQ